MARLPDLMQFAAEHGLKIGTIADLIEYRSRTESLVQKISTRQLVTAHGEFTAHAYKDLPSDSVHLALVRGTWTGSHEVLARVHALATAAGCQLVATCDLVIASEQAAFALPGGKSNLFCHTPLVAVSRSIGRKRALELALTGDPINAQTAADWGLVNRVVPRAELEAATLELAVRISRRSSMGLRLAKESVNRAEDRMGVTDVVHAAHSLHVLGHSHNLNTHGILVDPEGARVIRESKKK
ncbi:MAG: hypothetical protein RL430_1711, partial [Actinomycetota bacterium]